MLLRAVAATLVVFGGAGAVHASPRQERLTEQQEAPTELESIDVTGRLLRDQVETFVRQAAAPPPGRVLARWHDALCIGVSNLEPQYAQFMIDRIAALGLELGLEPGEPGCRPNVMIIAASDADELARSLVDDDPIGFRPSVNATDLGSDALERFRSTDAPVRWWHVSLPVSVDTGDVAVALKGEKIVGRQGGWEPLTLIVRDASHLRANTRDDLQRVFVIIDVSKVGRVGFGALSDYVALVSLAQFKMDGDTSAYPTVLNLFNDGADRSAGLTQWDRDYLISLYNADRDRARLSQQVRQIYRGISDQRAAQADEATGH